MGAIRVRTVREADLVEVAAMVDDFVEGHIAQHHPRPLAVLREAFLGERAVGELLVATRDDQLIGMVQWQRFYDPFWAMYGAAPESLYVKPEARGQAVALALIAEVCARSRAIGVEFLRGGADDPAVVRLYARVAIGERTHGFFISAEAFHRFADLAGKSPRELVRGLPTPDLNRVARLTS